MRLDRLHPNSLNESLQGLVQAVEASPGRTVWRLIRTSPSDKVQVGLKWDGRRYVIYLRRPGGQEDEREMEALVKALHLPPPSEVFEARGRLPRKWGPRKYLVGLCQNRKAV